MYQITANDIKMAVKEARSFNIETEIENASKTFEKQLKRGLIDQWEADKRMEEIKKFYQSEKKRYSEIEEISKNMAF